MPKNNNGEQGSMLLASMALACPWILMDADAVVIYVQSKFHCSYKDTDNCRP